MRTVDDVIRALPSPAVPRLPAPGYAGPGPFSSLGERLGLAVKSMERHMTDEGIQLFRGLEGSGYTLGGHGLTIDQTDVVDVLRTYIPETLVLQDKREWEGKTAGKGFDARETFRNVGVLKDTDDVFKLTVLKDAHRDPEYHRDSADEIGCHAWVTYYHPRIVKHLAPYVREEHLVRTYHSVDADMVPAYTAEGRLDKAILSGAVSGAYPLRTRLFKDARAGRLPNVEVAQHPGYGRDRCWTPGYLKLLSQFKVAICTSSAFGFAVRKIVEATACGCVVITDLPKDEVLPEIDGNLVRVSPDVSTETVRFIAEETCKDYLPGPQRLFAEKAKRFYDFRERGRRLAADIEALRKTYEGEE